MGINTRPPQTAISTTDTTVAIGGLPAAFLIVCVECQKHWPGSISLVYLAISGLLLVLWAGYLTVWPKASRYAAMAINGSIWVLLAAVLLFRPGQSSAIATELASTLLFWAPLIVAWWTWQWSADRLKLVVLLVAFFTLVIFLADNSAQSIPEHLILSLAVAAVIYHARHFARPPPSELTVRLRDPLTGLASPECFEAELAHVSAIADRYQLPLTLIGCQIDVTNHDKNYHDNLHFYADAIIDRLRTSDTVCRWDEKTFLILLPNTTEKQAASVELNIDAALQQFGLEGKPQFPISILMVEHQAGEDPMSTLGTLENKLAESHR